jgi:hypothetical protein
MFERLRAYIKYIILHRWYKVDSDFIEHLDKYWLQNPYVSPKTKKLYLKIKKLNQKQ